MGKPDLDVVPRLCTGSRVAPHAQLSDKTSDIRCAPSTLFSDLARAGFLLFPKHKTTLNGRHFQTIEEIQENVIREMCAMTESAFQEAFQQCKKRWERCITSRGNNFEGNSA